MNCYDCGEQASIVINNGVTIVQIALCKKCCEERYKLDLNKISDMFNKEFAVKMREKMKNKNNIDEFVNKEIKVKQ